MDRHNVLKEARLVNAEHEVQLHLLKQVQTAEREGKDCAELYVRLANCSRMHFESEEQLMQHHAYPDYKDHVGDHQQMLALAARLGEFGIAEDMLILLRRHISDRDAKLHAFLDERHRTAPAPEIKGASAP